MEQIYFLEISVFLVYKGNIRLFDFTKKKKSVHFRKVTHDV